jgi:hypothetical protein
MGAWGDFVVTWTEQESSGDEQVKAAQFTADGAPIGSPITVAAANGILDHGAKVAVENDHGGNFVVSYTQEERNPGPGKASEVWVAMYLAGGLLGTGGCILGICMLYDNPVALVLRALWLGIYVGCFAGVSVGALITLFTEGTPAPACREIDGRGFSTAPATEPAAPKE